MKTIRIPAIEVVEYEMGDKIVGKDFTTIEYTQAEVARWIAVLREKGYSQDAANQMKNDYLNALKAKALDIVDTDHEEPTITGKEWWDSLD